MAAFGNTRCIICQTSIIPNNVNNNPICFRCGENRILVELHGGRQHYLLQPTEMNGYGMNDNDDDDDVDPLEEMRNLGIAAEEPRCQGKFDSFVELATLEYPLNNWIYDWEVGTSPVRTFSELTLDPGFEVSAFTDVPDNKQKNLAGHSTESSFISAQLAKNQDQMYDSAAKEKREKYLYNHTEASDVFSVDAMPMKPRMSPMRNHLLPSPPTQFFPTVTFLFPTYLNYAQYLRDNLNRPDLSNRESPDNSVSKLARQSSQQQDWYDFEDLNTPSSVSSTTNEQRGREGQDYGYGPRGNDNRTGFNADSSPRYQDQQQQQNEQMSSFASTSRNVPT